MDNQIIARFDDKVDLMHLKDKICDQFDKGQAKFEISQRKYLDGSVENKIMILPMTKYDKISGLVTSMIKSFTLIMFILISIEIYKDINAHREALFQKLAIEMKNCQVEYQENQCEEHYQIESLTKRCQELEICMTQNIEVSIRTRQIWLQVLGHSIENLFNQLSWKTSLIMIMLTLILSLSLFKK